MFVKTDIKTHDKYFIYCHFKIFYIIFENLLNIM
jgi:hypothetical protein